MTMDFERSPGKVHVIQSLHVKDFVESFPEKLEESGNAKTPAPAKLFEKGGGGLMSEDRREVFHSMVMEGIFIAKRSRPDILLATTVLSGRVSGTTKSDWKLLMHLVRYVKATQDLHLVIDMRDFRSPQWYIDTAYGGHADFRSHSGGLLKSSNSGGGP